MAQTVVTFTATGTWTCPDGVTTAQVECWGGGGGGGAGTANPGSGGGGAGGAYARKGALMVVPGIAYDVTVATATGNAAGAGATGGDSSFGSPGTNLLTTDQQSVEAALGGWDSFADGSSSVVRSTDQAHDGMQSIKCTRNTTTGTTAICALTGASAPSVTAAAKYQYSYWAYTTVVGASFIAAIDWYNGATFVSSSASAATVLNANSWTRVGAGTEFTAPATATLGRTYVQTTAGTTTGDVIYVDDIFFGQYSNSVLAKGGAGGVQGTSTTAGGAGGTGSTTGCIGDSVFAGGNGSAVNTDLGGSAGGAGAGSTAAGANASASTGGTGANGGGSGANGVAVSNVGAAGTAPGGGAGGGNTTTATDKTGGIGAAGQVKVIYEVNVITQSVVQNAAINTANW